MNFPNVILRPKEKSQLDKLREKFLHYLDEIRREETRMDLKLEMRCKAYVAHNLIRNEQLVFAEFYYKACKEFVGIGKVAEEIFMGFFILAWMEVWEFLKNEESLIIAEI